jgi:hypothetical protein
MWQPLSKILETIGRIRLPLPRKRTAVTAGQPDTPDAQGGFEWQRYLSAEALFDAWGPVRGSVWEPFHCVTLFAALDRVVKGRIGPTDLETALALERAVGGSPAGTGAVPGWAGPGVFALLDLPGPHSVALGARLVSAGMQPVCTFDNWPHPAGLLQPEKVLAQLLRYASFADACRHPLTSHSPPVWMCDRDRFGTRPGRPREFDNRYYLDDSLLPGPDLLLKRGIHTAICVLPVRGEPLKDDVRFYFATLQKKGIETVWTSLSEEDLRLFRLESQAGRKPRFRAFKRSSAGGFGGMIPEPSSGSGS